MVAFHHILRKKKFGKSLDSGMVWWLFVTSWGRRRLVSHLILICYGGFFSHPTAGEEDWLVTWFWYGMVAFPRMQRFWRKVWRIILCLRLFFFFFNNQLAYANSTLWARIRPQWLNELGSVPWRIACELVYLTGSHTLPGQHDQTVPTLLGQECSGF